MPEINIQKGSSPPTTAASPEDSYRKSAQLRRAFACRSWAFWCHLSSDEHPAHRSWQFAPVRGSSAGGEPPKKTSPPTTAASPEFGHPPRFLVRRTFANRRSCSWRSLSSDEHPAHRSWRFPPGSGPSAGGEPPKRRSPPTTAASPEFGRRTMPPPASIRSPELSSQAQSCPPMSAPLIGADTPRGISPLFKKTPAKRSSSEFFSNMDDAFLNLCSALGVHFAVFAVADVLFVHFRQHQDRFDLDVDQRQQQDKIHW